MNSKKAKAVSAVASARRRMGVISGTIIILAFAAAVIVAVYFVLDQNTTMSRQNVYTMNSQLANSIQSRLDKMEEVTTRVLQSESYKKFDESVYKNSSRKYERFVKITKTHSHFLGKTMSFKESFVAEYTRCLNRWSNMTGHLAVLRAMEYRKLLERAKNMPDNINGWDYLKLLKNYE